jgi:hypothetical protein
MPRRRTAATAPRFTVAEYDSRLRHGEAIIRMGMGPCEIRRSCGTGAKAGFQTTITFDAQPSNPAVLEHAPYVATYLATLLKPAIASGAFKNCFNLMIRNLPSVDSAHFIYSAIHTLHVADMLGIPEPFEIQYMVSSDHNDSKYEMSLLFPLTAAAAAMCQQITDEESCPERITLVAKLLTGDY